MAEGRLFIGNVCPQATEDDFRNNLSSYGTVKKVEIKAKKDIDGNVLSTFAFVDMIANKSQLEECVEKCSGSSWWKGYKIKVQVAKESFMSRLARERELSTKDKFEPVVEARSHKGAPYKRIVLEKEETDFGDRVPDGKSIGGVIQFDEPHSNRNTSVRKSVRKYYSSSSDEDDETDGVRAKPKMPKYSGGAFMRKLESFDSDFWKEDEEKKPRSSERTTFNSYQDSSIHSKGRRPKDVQNPNLEPIGGVHAEKNLGKARHEKLFDQNLNPNLEPLGTSGPTKSHCSNDDDAKRVLSLKQRQAELKRKKDNISLALRGQGPNKIARYDDSDEEPDTKTKLFDQSDEEDNDTDRFRERPEFEGPSGHRLLGLQSNFGGDDRFKMDHRFADTAGVKTKLVKKPKDKTFKDSTKFRFDPSDDKNTLTVEKSDDEESEEDEEEVQNHSETLDAEKMETRFYEVSQDLKSAFIMNKETNTSSGSFSLLKAFGKESEPIAEKVDYVASKIKSDKKKDVFTANPFKYDSSDNEDEEDSTSKIIPNNKPQTNFPSYLKGSKSIVSENFFFVENDDRFGEAIEFLNSIGETLDEIRTKYEDERPALASIIRKKYRNKAHALEQRSRGFGVSSDKMKKKKRVMKIRKRGFNKK